MDFFTLNAAKRYADEAMEGAGAIQGEKGEKGETGEKGADGVSCTHSWNGTKLTVTSASGTSEADLKGEKGDTGEKGADAVIPTPEYIEFYSDDDGYLTIGGIYGRLIDIGTAYLWSLYGAFETVGNTNVTLNFTSDTINKNTLTMGHGMLQYFEYQTVDGKTTPAHCGSRAMVLTTNGFMISLQNKQDTNLGLHGFIVLLKK
ncbi:MAG: hypothetical protein IJV71_05570 [Lachnospiraceae bacterium]|nr:hypothetical protein [Lachnospiraceae bacterium]